MRVAGRDRVGGVGLDEDRRLLAADEVAAEIRRDLHHELHRAARAAAGRARPRSAAIVRQVEVARSFCSAAMKERVNTLSSWISTAVGRCFGSVLMA